MSTNDYNKELDDILTKLINENTIINQITDLIKDDQYNLFICKQLDDFQFLNDQNFRSDNYVFPYQGQDEKCIYLDHEKKHCCETTSNSASDYGEKDFHIIFSYFGCYLSDYPYEIFNVIKEMNQKILNIENLVECLENNTHFKDVELMSPRARDLDGDTYEFMVGFNLI